MLGCKGGSKNPIEGKWKVIEVKAENPAIFMDEVWEFKNNRYSVEGLSLRGKYELGKDDDRNTIMLFPDIESDVDIAGIYELRKEGKELIMKLGNAENEMPNFPEDFTEDIMWYDVIVCSLVKE